MRLLLYQLLPMKQAVALVTIILLAACARSVTPATATYDQFPMAKGPHAVKSIAILPGGELADAIGVELGERGFVVFPAASTAGRVPGVDFKAVAESYIPKRENPRLVEDVKRQLVVMRCELSILESGGRRSVFRYGRKDRLLVILDSTDDDLDMELANLPAMLPTRAAREGAELVEQWASWRPSQSGP